MQEVFAEGSGVDGREAASSDSGGASAAQKRCQTCSGLFDLRHYKAIKGQPAGRWVECRGCQYGIRELNKEQDRLLLHLGDDVPMLDR